MMSHYSNAVLFPKLGYILLPYQTFLFVNKYQEYISVIVCYGILFKNSLKSTTFMPFF